MILKALKKVIFQKISGTKNVLLRQFCSIRFFFEKMESLGAKKKKKKLSYAQFAPRGPPLKFDHRDLCIIDRRILGLLHSQYGRGKGRFGISPETMLKRLNELSPGMYTIENIWASLDSPTMQQYVYRKNRLLWALITEGQKEDLIKEWE
jgi:hypothetical protein